MVAYWIEGDGNGSGKEVMSPNKAELNKPSFSGSYHFN